MFAKNEFGKWVFRDTSALLSQFGSGPVTISTKCRPHCTVKATHFIKISFRLETNYRLIHAPVRQNVDTYIYIYI